MVIEILLPFCCSRSLQAAVGKPVSTPLFKVLHKIKKVGIVSFTLDQKMKMVWHEEEDMGITMPSVQRFNKNLGQSVENFYII